MEQIADKDESLFYFETPLGTGFCSILRTLPFLILRRERVQLGGSEGHASQRRASAQPSGTERLSGVLFF